MTLVSITTRGFPFQMRAYAIVGGRRTKLVEVAFDACPSPEDMEAIRRNPIKFVADLSRAEPEAGEFAPSAA